MLVGMSNPETTAMGRWQSLQAKMEQQSTEKNWRLMLFLNWLKPLSIN